MSGTSRHPNRPDPGPRAGFGRTGRVRGVSEIADIKDEDSLETWLDNQPRDVSVWIAPRAAARVFPVSWHAVLTGGWFRDQKLTSLPGLRRILVATVAAKGFDPQIAAAATDVSSDEIAGIPSPSSAETDGAGRAAVKAATTIASAYQGCLSSFQHDLPPDARYLADSASLGSRSDVAAMTRRSMTSGRQSAARRPRGTAITPWACRRGSG